MRVLLLVVACRIVARRQITESIDAARLLSLRESLVEQVAYWEELLGQMRPAPSSIRTMAWAARSRSSGLIPFMSNW